MEQIDAERQAIRELVAAHLATSARFPRIWVQDAQMVGQESAMLALPRVGKSIDLQDADGNRYFVAGVSDPSGPDIIKGT